MTDSTINNKNPIPDGWIIKRGTKDSPFEYIEIKAPNGYTARVGSHERNPMNVLYMLANTFLTDTEAKVNPESPQTPPQAPSQTASQPQIQSETSATTYDPSVVERARRVIAEQLGVSEEEVQPQKTFEELGADSLDVVELVMAVEDAFLVEISEKDAEDMTQVSHLYEYLTNKS